MWMNVVLVMMVAARTVSILKALIFATVPMDIISWIIRKHALVFSEMKILFYNIE